MGITNPTSASTTFNLLLYSYWYSSSFYALTMSSSTTYTVDTTYTPVTYVQIPKSSVYVYPFQARISTVSNAPLRIRFSLLSGSNTVANTWGQLVFTYDQIAYSATHLCYIIAYTSYAAMMQQT